MQVSEPAEYVILGLLKSRPMHGYEMFQHIEGGTLGQIVHLEMSQMYAFLKKLDRLGYIEAELEHQGVRPPRKIFRLSEVGQEVFRAWLTEPVEKPRDIRILFLIKLYFVQRFLPTDTSYLIERQIGACQHFLAHLEAQQSEQFERSEQPEELIESGCVETPDVMFFNHVVLRSRIHQTRSLLEWLRELQQEMAGV